MRPLPWTFLFALCLAASLGSALTADGEPPEPSPDDAAFKSAHLATLRPYGPSVRESQRTVWQRMLQLAADFDDEEIVDRIFDLMGETDGVTATQYSLDLYELMQRDPLLVVKSAHRYFGGDTKALPAVWINESFDFGIVDLIEATRAVQDVPLVTAFLEEARRMDAELRDVELRDVEPVDAGALDDGEVLAIVRAVRASLDSGDAAEKAAGLDAFTGLYLADWDILAPRTWTALGPLSLRVRDLARSGDLEAIEALQVAATGPYATSAEGLETFGEYLWELLEVQARTSLDALAGQSTEIRSELMRLHYREPLHDLYDFPEIVDALDRSSPSAAVARETRDIRAAAWKTLELFGATPEGFRAWQLARSAERKDPPDLEEASRCYLEAMDRSPEWADPHRRLGCVYGRLGRYLEAERELRRYLELRPGLPPGLTGEIEAQIVEFSAAEDR